jgi:hypothetical protein
MKHVGVTVARLPNVRNQKIPVLTFGADFLYQLQRPMAHNELKALERYLRSQDPSIQSLSASVVVPNRYYAIRKPVILSTRNPKPSTVGHWSENQKAGRRVCERWQKFLSDFGLRYLDSSVYDAYQEDKYAPERSTFNTPNPRTWEIILNWLFLMEPDKAKAIQKTRHWWTIYPESLVHLLKPKSSS